MRILVIAPRFPWPLNKGDRLTVYHFLEHFSVRHVVDLVTFGERGFGDDYKPEFKGEIIPFCREIEIVPLGRTATYVQAARSVLTRDPLQVWYFRRNRMFKKVREMVSRNDYDVIYTHLLRMAQYTENIKVAPKVIGMQISLALEYKRYAKYQNFLPNPLRKMMYQVEANKLRTYEAQMTKRFERTLLIGDKDREEVIRNGGDAARIILNPHGVDLAHAASGWQEKISGSIAISGNMHTAANIDAVLYFYHRIFPLVRQEIPDACLYIIGTSPSKEIRKLARDRKVVVTGYVENLAALLSRCEVAVDPLRIGAGFQNKVLEAMALGVPVVATPTANEGIHARSGEQILVAEDDGMFAHHVVALLNQKELRDEMAANAHRFVLEKFTWAQHYCDLEKEFIRLTTM